MMGIGARKRLGAALCALMVVAAAAAVSLTANAAEPAAGTPGLAAGAAATDQGVATAAAKPAKYAAASVATKTKKGHLLLNDKYLIAPAVSTDQLSKLLAASGSGVKALGESSGKGAQWKIQYERNGKNAYTIVNVKTKKALTLSGSKVVQSKLNKKNGKQYWVAVATKGGYSFAPKSNKKLALTVKGSKVTVSKSRNDASQRFWLFSPSKWKAGNVLKNGTFTLSPASDSSKLLGIDGNSTKLNAKAVLASKKASLDRMFMVAHSGGGYYKLQVISSGKLLTAMGDKVVQTKDVYRDPFRKAGTPAQLWKAVVSPEGGIVFVNKKTGKLLDAADGTVGLAQGSAKSATADERWLVSPTTTTLSLIEQQALTYANYYAYNYNLKAERKDHPKKKHFFQVKTNWYISIDMTTHTAVIFKRANKTAAWKVAKVFTVSSGSGHNTMVGNRTTTGKTHRWHGGDTYSAQYWTGLNYGSWIHSILYFPGGHGVRDGRLGYSISSGCIRMAVNNARWVWTNIGNRGKKPSGKGTGVSTYY